MKSKKKSAMRRNIPTFDDHLTDAERRYSCRQLSVNDDNTVDAIVRLSAEQLMLFKPAAEANKCTIGELILALACLELTLYPAEGDVDSDGTMHDYLASALWNYSTGRQIPDAGAPWGEVGFAVRKEVDA